MKVLAYAVIVHEAGLAGLSLRRKGSGRMSNPMQKGLKVLRDI